MYSYDERILKKLQNTELSMLKDFDEVCRTNGINYFVNFGTLIGAVRHNGFIPWDDDIDIGMMREDYEKLCSLPSCIWDKCKSEIYLVKPEDNDLLHRSIYPKLYKKNTVFETEYHYKYSNMKNIVKGCYLPIWIDIFVYDRFKSIKEVKKKCKLAFVLKKLFYYSKCKINIVKKDKLLVKIFCFIKNITHRVLNLFNTPEKHIYNLYLKLINNEGEYVTSLDFDYIYESVRLCCKYEDMFPIREIKFEDIEVPIQKNYNESLQSLYGDYMIMPPQDKRVNHPPHILDFGDGINVMRKR